MAEAVQSGGNIPPVSLDQGQQSGFFGPPDDPSPGPLQPHDRDLRRLRGAQMFFMTIPAVSCNGQVHSGGGGGGTCPTATVGSLSTTYDDSTTTPHWLAFSVPNGTYNIVFTNCGASSAAFVGATCSTLGTPTALSGSGTTPVTTSSGMIFITFENNGLGTATVKVQQPA